MKKPKVGEKIVHTDHLGVTRTGMVDVVLSMQFVYRAEDGSRQFCMFKEDWKEK